MTVRTPHQLTQNVKLLQKIGLFWQGKVLMLQRDGESASRPLCWDLPGGNSEWPENITQPTSDLHIQDAIREIAEETGIQISADHFQKPNLTYVETFFDPEKQIFTVLFGWSIELQREPPQVQLSEEHIAFQWLPVPEALELDLGGSKGAFLQRILQSK